MANGGHIDEWELRSEEVQEFLGTPPHWLVRWGLLGGLLVFLLLAWLSYLLSYPETVTTELRVTTEEPPRRLLAENTSFITQILAGNEDTVQAGQTIMVFRSTAKFEDVMTLQDQLLQANADDDSVLLSFTVPADLILGELEESLYQFIERQEEARTLRSGRLANLSIEQLRRRIQQEQANINYEARRKESYETQLRLIEQNYIREQNLLGQGLSDASKVRSLQEQKIQMERLIQSSEAVIKNKRIEVQIMRRELEGYRSDSDEVLPLTGLRERFNALENAVDLWTRNHLLVTPIDGVLILPSDLRENQYVQSDAELAVVLPLNAAGLVGRASVPLDRAAKVEPGQKVVVDFFPFPAQTYGAVVGRVRAKDKVPTNGQVSIEVEFPNGLVTSTGQSLDAPQDLGGNAQIIIEEKRLIEWLLR
jgi:multidrug efflux pump subunit AcrA (membrane-fusion protein)